MGSYPCFSGPKECPVRATTRAHSKEYHRRAIRTLTPANQWLATLLQDDPVETVLFEARVSQYIQRINNNRRGVALSDREFAARMVRQFPVSNSAVLLGRHAIKHALRPHARISTRVISDWARLRANQLYGRGLPNPLNSGDVNGFCPFCQGQHLSARHILGPCVRNIRSGAATRRHDAVKTLVAELFNAAGMTSVMESPVVYWQSPGSRPSPESQPPLRPDITLLSPLNEGFVAEISLTASSFEDADTRKRQKYAFLLERGVVELKYDGAPTVLRGRCDEICHVTTSALGDVPERTIVALTHGCNIDDQQASGRVNNKQLRAFSRAVLTSGMRHAVVAMDLLRSTRRRAGFSDDNMYIPTPFPLDLPNAGPNDGSIANVGKLSLVCVPSADILESYMAQCRRS